MQTRCRTEAELIQNRRKIEVEQKQNRSRTKAEIDERQTRGQEQKGSITKAERHVMWILSLYLAYRQKFNTYILTLL